jgi:hypothetical protein
MMPSFSLGTGPCASGEAYGVTLTNMIWEKNGINGLVYPWFMPDGSRAGTWIPETLLHWKTLFT